MALDTATQERLDKLRRYDSIGMYASDESASGDDPSGAVTVTVDPTDRVIAVTVRDRDAIRSTEGLRQAVELAFQAARMHRLGVHTPSGKPSGPLTVDSGPSPRPILLVTDESDRHVPQPRDRSGPTVAQRDFGPTSGVSDNDCVTVTLDVASSHGTVDADQGWLSTALPTKIGDAITQAFAQAYGKRDAS